MSRWTEQQQRDHRRRLVDELRTGHYQQAYGTLRAPAPEQPRGRSRYAYCIMGVACEVSGLGSWARLNDEGQRYVTGMNEGAGGMLNRTLCEYYGFATETGDFQEERHDPFNAPALVWTSLVAKNDGRITLRELADIIEAEPPGLIGDYLTPLQVKKEKGLD